MSVNIAFFLTMRTEGGRINFSLLPGSHIKDEIEFSAYGVSDPEGVVEILASPDTAVIFDWRIWCEGGRNSSNVTRKTRTMSIASFRSADNCLLLTVVLQVSPQLRRPAPICGSRLVRVADL